MFADIEKQYKKLLFFRKFDVGYWIIAAITIIINYILYRSLSFKKFTNFIVPLLVFSIAYFVLEFCRLRKRHSNMSFCHFWKDRHQILVDERINKLLYVLKEYHCQTKEEITLILNHFRGERSRKVSTGYILPWISSWIGVASFLLGAYDKKTSKVNFSLIVEIGVNATIIILYPFIFYILYKMIVHDSTLTKNNRRKSLIEDLIYIILHYDDYKHILLEEDNSPSLLPNNKKDTK